MNRKSKIKKSRKRQLLRRFFFLFFLLNGSFMAQLGGVMAKKNLRWENRFEPSLTCLNFAMASDEIKSPFWNFVTKHITWYWLWPRSSSPSTRAFSTWTSCVRWVGDDCCGNECWRRTKKEKKKVVDGKKTGWKSKKVEELWTNVPTWSS